MFIQATLCTTTMVYVGGLTSTSSCIFFVNPPYAPLGFWSLNSLFPEGYGGGGIFDFKAKFKWAILKIKAKVTLLQFFGHISISYGPISKMDAFWRSGSVGGGRRCLALWELPGIF